MNLVDQARKSSARCGSNDETGAVSILLPIVCLMLCLSGRSFLAGGKVRCKISGGTVHRAGLGKQRLSTLGPGGLTHLLQEDLSGSEHVRASEEDED